MTAKVSGQHISERISLSSNKMKLCVAILLLTISLSCYAINNNGQPGCKTDVEMEVVNYRNVWDPTSYWTCKQQGVAASHSKCPDGTGWQDNIKKCVDWDNWTWEEAVKPPSTP